MQTLRYPLASLFLVGSHWSSCWIAFMCLSPPEHVPATRSQPALPRPGGGSGVAHRAGRARWAPAVSSASTKRAASSLLALQATFVTLNGCQITKHITFKLPLILLAEETASIY